MENAFVTGSRVYGTPREDSDVDLAVMVSRSDLALLRELADKVGGSNGDSLLFGRLNLVILPPDEFEAWKEATEQLVGMKPVEREKAIEVIEEAKAVVRCG